jgi:hypothetical protein
MIHDPLWDSYDRAASEALNEHRYTKASRIVKDALTKANQLRTPQPNMLQHADELATVYRDAGDYNNAASLYRMIIEVQKTTLGPEHPDVESSSNKLIAALKASGCISPEPRTRN